MANEQEKKQELLDFLRERVFDPILNSPSASTKAKQGVRFTMRQMEKLNASGIRDYFWSAMIGTEYSIPFADLLASEHLPRFEDVFEEFRARFTDQWLLS